MAVTLSQVQEKLAHLLGESAAPAENTSEYNQRTTFIQATLEEIYRVHPFTFNKVTATVPLVNGIASLPTGVAGDTSLDIRELVSGTNDDNIYDQVPYEIKDNYAQGSYRYWLTGSEGNLLLNTAEGDTTLTIRYTTTTPIINASISTPFPSAMLLARGALRDVRVTQNPFADTSQEEDIFSRRLSEFVAQYNRNVPQRIVRTVQERQGRATGDI